MASGATSESMSLKQFKLSGVQRTPRAFLGKGAYGQVEEYVYRDLKCAGKKLLPILRECTDEKHNRALLDSAAKECVILSGLKHPNIVQFLGVHFEEGDPTSPILIMEYVPHTLSGFLEANKTQEKVIPPEIIYGILIDVAKALCYLHGGDPVVIHRDLSANNVLLTRDLRAKVSDLGTARILRVSVNEKVEWCQKMTKCPGTPVYMPPESRVDMPVYDENLDCYSYGVLILHVLTGEWPVRSEDNQIKDIERRRKYIDMIDPKHPLMELICGCLDDRSKRPSAKKILTEVEKAQKRQCHWQTPDRMSLLIQQRKDVEKMAELAREREELKEEKKKMERTHSVEKEKLNEEKKGLELCHIEEKQKMMKDMDKFENENNMLRSLVEIRNTEQEALEKRVESKSEMLEKKEQEMMVLKQQMEKEVEAVKKKCEDELDMYKKQKDEETDAKEKEINAYKEKLLKRERIIEDAIKRIEERAQKAHEDLHKSQEEKGTVMEYLRSATHMHPLHHRAQPLKWREGPCLPMGMTAPQCVLIENSLYMGGGQTLNADKDYRSLIFEYDTSDINREKWKSPFPQCPTEYFALGELNGKLVIVGGERENKDKNMVITGEVFVLDEEGKWRGDQIPAMKTPRMRSCVVSFQSCIAACGGLVHVESEKECSAVVEIYRSKTNEWCTVSPLPKARAALRVSIIYKTAYFLGGFYPNLTYPGKPNCISIELEDLFQADDKKQRRWNESVCDAPCESSTPASLCGSLIALGGLESPGAPSQTKAIYAYSPAMNAWYLIDELPIFLKSATAITLPSGKLVVLGGRRGEERNTDVCIGSLE